MSCSVGHTALLAAAMAERLDLMLVLTWLPHRDGRRRDGRRRDGRATGRPATGR
ncbi:MULTISPECIES: hypothetical protein [Streptomyces]|uniref:hypothetical protein n=1 Tax=Streptomyces TaxID=1883 RepID=UPI00030E188A|nr:MULTISPECIES: hypothetical protein [Streptomyces]MYT00157.1 hypothetical protein [Streptomyces sp. SID5469]